MAPSKWFDANGATSGQPKKIAFYSKTSAVQPGAKRKLENQHFKLANNFARILGLPPFSRRNVYLDYGFSGLILKRTVLSTLIDRVKNNEVREILVLATADLLRDGGIYYALLHLFESNGATFRSIIQPIDTSTTGRKLTTLMGQRILRFSKVPMNERRLKSRVKNIKAKKHGNQN